jgi:hypothetical protein
MANFEKQVASEFIKELVFIEKLVQLYLNSLQEASNVPSNPEYIKETRETAYSWVSKKYLLVNMAGRIFGIPDDVELNPIDYYKQVLEELKLIAGES